MIRPITSKEIFVYKWIILNTARNNQTKKMGNWQQRPHRGLGRKLGWLVVARQGKRGRKQPKKVGQQFKECFSRPCWPAVTIIPMKKVKPWWNIKQLFFAIYELKLCSSTSITWTLNLVWEKLKKKTMTHIKMRLRIGTAKCATVGFPGGRSHSVIIIWEGLILTLIIFTRQQGWVFVDAYIPEDVKHPLHWWSW